MRLAGFVFLLLILGVSSCAGQPLFTFTLAPGEVKNAVLDFEYWIEASEDWILSFRCASGLNLFGKEEDPLPAAAFKGKGPAQARQSLKVVLDSAKFNLGSQKAEIAIELNGAQGILGLSSQGNYWIMPLNSEDVCVGRASGDEVCLEDYQWFLLSGDDRVIWGDRRINVGNGSLQAEKMRPGTKGGDSRLSWSPSSLLLDAGEKVSLSLQLPGPAPAQRLVFSKPEDLLLSSIWVLEGYCLKIENEPGATSLVLAIPPLTAKQNQLRGSIQALLPQNSGPSKVLATYGKEEALLKVFRSKGWFDRPSLEQIEICDEQGALGAVPCLLPGGIIRYTNQEGELSFYGERFGPLFVPSSRDGLVWISPGTGGLLHKFLLTEEAELEIPDFVFPVLILDPDFSWRLTAKSGSWFLNADPKKQVLRGQIGPIRVRAEEGQFHFWSGLNQPLNWGEWLWAENQREKAGTWQKGSWSVGVAFPRETGKNPTFRLEHRRGGYRVKLSPSDLEFSYGTGDWSLGAGLKERLLWVNLDKEKFRLELKKESLQLDYGTVSRGRWLFRSHMQRPFYLQYRRGAREFYLGKDREDGWRAGFGWDAFYANGSWQGVLKNSWWVGGGLVLGEIAHTLKYELSDYWAIYARNTLQLSSPWNKGAVFSSQHELGLLCQPSAYWFNQLGWNNKSGLVWRIGLAWPLIGRGRDFD
ncbi:MAG: hypothetical protein GX335_06995 [Firmicutes bacterium]|nr:hypothetical protein [Bacillota bacterium]